MGSNESPSGEYRSMGSVDACEGTGNTKVNTATGLSGS